jgi:hypothetical protein
MLSQQDYAWLAEAFANVQASLQQIVRMLIARHNSDQATIDEIAAQVAAQTKELGAALVPNSPITHRSFAMSTGSNPPTPNTLQSLEAQVASEGTVIQSAVTLIQGLAAQVAALAPNQAAIDSLAAAIQSQASSLAAAVQANTPAASASGTASS